MRKLRYNPVCSPYWCNKLDSDSREREVWPSRSGGGQLYFLDHPTFLLLFVPFIYLPISQCPVQDSVCHLTHSSQRLHKTLWHFCFCSSSSLFSCRRVHKAPLQLSDMLLITSRFLDGRGIGHCYSMATACAALWKNHDVAPHGPYSGICTSAMCLRGFPLGVAKLPFDMNVGTNVG